MSTFEPPQDLDHGIKFSCPARTTGSSAATAMVSAYFAGFTIPNTFTPRSNYLYANQKLNLFWPNEPSIIALLVEKSEAFDIYRQELDPKRKMKLFKRDKVTFGAFNLNQQGGLDLNDFIIPRTDPDYRIANIYDVNKDGLNDLIVYNKSTIYWMKNIGSGAYSAPLKVKKIWSNKSNIEVIEPGLIVIEKDEDESVDYLILDFRGEKEPAIFRFNQGKLEPWIEAIYLDNLGYYSVFFDDSQSLCIKSSRSNRTIKQRGITRGQYSLADFDNDGLLDIVTIDSMRVIINWGYKDGSFIQGIDLLQVDELIENGELIAWAADSKYTSEEVIELSLNWLEDGEFDLVDFNGDSLVDILFHGEFFIVFENNGDNTFSRKFIGGPFDPNQFQAVDLNDDGRLEIVINAYFGQVLIENSAEGYSITELLSNGYMEDTFTGDIDQDGDLDILILNEDQLLYWSENLNGKYQKAVWWLNQ